MTSEFRFRSFPDSQGNYGGVLVLVPGSNSDGRNMVFLTHFEKLARENHLLIVACKFQDEAPAAIEKYCNFKMSEGREAGEALLKAIEGMTRLSRFDEHFPKLYLWGFSAGGQFAYEFTCWVPALVGGFVLNKGGVYYTALANEAAREVPGKLIIGNLDESWRQDIVQGIFKVNKRFGARWDFLVEPGIGHEIGISERVGAEFFAGLIKAHKGV